MSGGKGSLRNKWRYSDYAIILVKGGAMYVMGTHRYGTEAALLWLSRKPLFYSYAQLFYFICNNKMG
jgi:hypothetical protein